MIVALSKLIRDLSWPEDLQDHNYETLWDLVENLDSVTFSSLHKNLYFIDFFRQILVKFNDINLDKNKLESVGDGFQLELIKSSKEIEIQAILPEDTLVVPNLATSLDLVDRKSVV